MKNYADPIIGDTVQWFDNEGVVVEICWNNPRPIKVKVTAGYNVGRICFIKHCAIIKKVAL